MKTLHLKVFLALSILLLGIVACSPTTTATPVPSIPPSAVPTIPPTAIISQRVKFTSTHAEESNQGPNYTITTETPTLEGLDDGRVIEFNVTMQLAVKSMVDGFKTSMKDQPVTPIVAGSSFDVKYELLSPPGDIYSIKFNVMGYTDGAAHPYHFSKTVTFDLSTGMEVTFDQLFLPGSNYLQLISDTCKADLSKRDIAFDMFSSGADPLPENYKSWNITADGLLITFDEYQVAAYAAGPQTVVIPFSTLKSVIAPQGPLGKFIQ